MKKPIFTLIVCAALVVGGFFGAKAIINRERTVQAESMQAQQSGKAKIVWYHPSDENEQLDWTNLSEKEITAIMYAQGDAENAYVAFCEAVENELPKGMHYPDWFGGCWIGSDNKLHVAFARCADDAARELVEKALSGYSSKVFYEEDMPYSYNELYRAKEGAADYLLEKGFKLTDFGLDERFNRIRIGAPSEELEAVAACRAELEALFPYPIVFVEHGYAVLD